MARDVFTLSNWHTFTGAQNISALGQSQNKCTSSSVSYSQNQQDVHVRTSQVSVDEFVDNELEFELGTSSRDINLGEPNAFESRE